jgi:hypothetical protein
MEFRNSMAKRNLEQVSQAFLLRNGNEFQAVVMNVPFQSSELVRRVLPTVRLISGRSIALSAVEQHPHVDVVLMLKVLKVN